MQERGLTRRAVAFFRQDEPTAAARPAEPGRPPGWPDWAVDTAIAVVATIAAAWAAAVQIRNGQAPYAIPGPDGGRIITPYMPLYVAYLLVLGAMLTTAPLAFRRRYPGGMFCVIMVAVFATSGHSTIVTFAAVLFAAYSAILYSPYRRLALLCVFTAAAIVTAAFPNTTPPVPARFTALLVLLPTAAVAAGMRTWQRRAGDSAERLRLAQAEHEAQTMRAVEAERARIASELHDVVTHNVSVMVVQAGAARSVLGSSPEEAREALLAVEASGRTAMGELRHLLGLLAPAGDPGSGAEQAALVPQPGLGQVQALVDRVRAAGLPTELVTEGARPLPPGVDLAAYRVVQEALTNVLKHGGGARAVVRSVYGERELVITVTDDGSPAGGGPQKPPGAGRGLIGLRERLGLYGGELDAGPRPGGGWRVRAVIPLEPA
ncbi:MAG TPA: sensor histidine kinase [Streptosporangiaceae bacterium]|nr:sensor histidine kinase [Streptosporangiaceae bacterium]